MTHSRPTRTLFEWCSHSFNVMWGANCFNITAFLLNSWAGLFKVVYPRLYGMSWRHFTVSMNPEFLAKFTLGGNVAMVVLIKWFYGASTLCTSPRLHFKLNAIHGHATWQHNSPSLLKLKIQKRRCQIARFAGGHCIIRLDYGPLRTGTDTYTRRKSFLTSVFSDIIKKLRQTHSHRSVCSVVQVSSCLFRNVKIHGIVIKPRKIGLMTFNAFCVNLPCSLIFICVYN